MHDSGDGAEDACAVIHEADELADGGLFPQINDASQCGVVVAFRPDLREEDATFEVIHDGLPPLGGPPFDGDVALSACGDDPIRHVATDDLCDLGSPRALDGVKVDVAFEVARAEGDAELLR